jgi:hypothetical protein
MRSRAGPCPGTASDRADRIRGIEPGPRWVGQAQRRGLRAGPHGIRKSDHGLRRKHGLSLPPVRGLGQPPHPNERPRLALTAEVILTLALVLGVAGGTAVGVRTASTAAAAIRPHGHARGAWARAHLASMTAIVALSRGRSGPARAHVESLIAAAVAEGAVAGQLALGSGCVAGLAGRAIARHRARAAYAAGLRRAFGRHAPSIHVAARPAVAPAFVVRLRPAVAIQGPRTPRQFVAAL